MTNHYETRYQSDYIAKLRDDGTTCTEIVFYRGGQIHRAEFPSSNLGTAKRGEYLDCMVVSVAREHRRNVAVETTTEPAPVAPVPEFRINVQCTDSVTGKTGCFITPAGEHTAITPIFDSLAGLYPWIQANGWKSDEGYGAEFIPWRVVKLAPVPAIVEGSEELSV
jgi:hypothetical protein